MSSGELIYGWATYKQFLQVAADEQSDIVESEKIAEISKRLKGGKQ
jgi:hypothetical protein